MISRKVFGTMPDGRDVYAYTLTNSKGASVKIMEYGGIIIDIYVPDKDGNFADVTCGYDTLADYLAEDQNQGALIGRYGNRIGKGKFTLNGEEIQLNLNDGNNHLHGGPTGFGKRVWDSEVAEHDGYDTVTLKLTSPDGDENYPGKLEVTVVYTFDEDNTLSIDYTATTDKDTLCNLTNHAYFNLAGFNGGDICNHKIRIDADRYTETDDELIPTGNLPAVDGTKFDLREFTMLTEYYDDNFCLNGEGMRLIAEAVDTVSGRGMQVYTDLPGVQLYTGGFMGGDILYKRGVKSEPHHAFCLETQCWPDSPNHENFTNTVLRAGETYHTTTKYRFFA